jgi:hypothetical protein
MSREQNGAQRIGPWDRASGQDDAMPRSKEFLLEQIARAQRFAAAMNTDADRERFEKMAADYRNELDAAEATENQSSAAPTASEDAAPTDDATAAQPQTGGSDSTAPTSGSTDDQEPTTN